MTGSLSALPWKWLFSAILAAPSPRSLRPCPTCDPSKHPESPLMRSKLSLAQQHPGPSRQLVTARDARLA